jgi:glyoxylase-like metal-dependent hydrolase (beta-lactamase superfamily II)
MIGRRTIAIAATLVLMSFAAGVSAQSKLQLTVYTGRGVNGYDVNSALITGEKDALLIDAQFTLSEAHRLAAVILESKKNLTTIYITHPHPDHMFGLAVLKQAFPQARVLAMSHTAAGAKTGWPNRQRFWVATYGNNIPGPDPVLPEDLTEPFLTLEGERFPVTGPVGGSDGAGNTFVHIPSLKAVVTGDIVFDRAYFGVQKDKAREEWLKTLDQILALKPEIIVPGHEGPGATRNVASIAFMKKYVADWDANVARSKDAAEMRANVLKQYPGLGMEFTLDQRITAYFPAAPAPAPAPAPAQPK